MCTKMKSALLATLAIAATCAATPPAFGQDIEPLAHHGDPRIIAGQEITNSADGVCPLVAPSPPPLVSPMSTSGGCRFHISGLSIPFVYHMTMGGMEPILTQCNIEAEVRITSTGEGYLTHQELTQGVSGLCTRKACGNPVLPTDEDRAWSFYLREMEPAPTERATILFCVEVPGMPATAQHCEFTIPFTQTSRHMYQMSGSDLNGHGAPAYPRCEYAGILRVEAPMGSSGEGLLRQKIEIRHA